MKIIALIALALVALSVAACGGKGSTGSAQPGTVKVEAPSHEFSDKAGFEQGVSDSLANIAAEDGRTVSVVSMDCVKTGDTTAECVSNVDEDGIETKYDVNVTCSSTAGDDCIVRADPY
jgi:hypothetical protein